MSSATATDAPISGTDPLESHTYWCHECDMSVSLRPSSSSPSPSSSSLLCPHCFGNFLELMDSSLSSPLSTPPPPPPPLSHPHHSSDDNFLLDSPYLHRLVQHLAADDYFSNNPNPNTTTTTNSSSLPASNASVEALLTVKIASSLLEFDPLLFCAVCKDQFVLDVEAKQLPCKHLYHHDCILPWLSNHSTCPVCRFQLPTRPINPRRSSTGLVGTTPFRFGDMLTRDEDWFGYGNTLRYIARRHRHLLSEGGNANGDENSSSLSPTQMAEAEMGFAARTSSVETVSSWPLEAGAGSREMGVSGTGRENEDGAGGADVKVSSSSIS